MPTVAVDVVADHLFVHIKAHNIMCSYDSNINTETAAARN